MNFKGYDIKYKPGCVTVKNVRHFIPEQVFECGQCFRWSREDDGSYTGVAHGRVVNVRMSANKLVIDNTSPEDFKNIWFDYFDLGRDYSRVVSAVACDSIMEKAVDFGFGIRLLRQDFFETLVSFILSSNNAIPRIVKIVEALSRMYGRELSYNGRKYYAFPSPNDLADTVPEELAACRGGYRCRYISETAGVFAGEPADLSILTSGSPEGAREVLKEFSGVGDKVADCTLLYSGTRYDVFPTDVWVKRVMEELYFKRKSTFREIRSFAASHFGAFSGFAQQYLFYYAREKRIGAWNNN